MPISHQQFTVFPNPVFSSATISFDVPNTEKISIRIFDLSGRLVKLLADKIFEKGEYRINLNTDDMSAGWIVFPKNNG